MFVLRLRDFGAKALDVWAPACTTHSEVLVVTTGACVDIYWGYIGIMEKKMETIIMGYIGYISGLYWDNGKERK